MIFPCIHDLAKKFNWRAVAPSLFKQVLPGDEASQHLRYASATDAKMAGECRTAFKPARVKKSLIVAGELERITAYCGGRIWFWFPGERHIPREDGDDCGSM